MGAQLIARALGRLIQVFRNGQKFVFNTYPHHPEALIDSTIA